MVAAAVSDSKSVVSRQRSHTPQPPDTHSRQRSQTPQPPNPPAAAVSAKQSKPRKAPSSKPADAPPLAVQPRSLDVMFKSIPEYVVFVGGLFLRVVILLETKLRFQNRFIMIYPLTQEMPSNY
jgi:hypothetical protein